MNAKERLKFVREYLGGISQQKLAAELGCKKTTISSVETGTQKTPPYDLALLLNEKYSFSVKWFMKGEEPKFDVNNNSLLKYAKRPEKYVEALENWGKRLNHIRKTNNLTNEEFAKLLNMPLKRYLALCLENKEPTIKELIYIKSNFNVQLDDLLFDENNTFFNNNKLSVQTQNTPETPGPDKDNIQLSPDEIIKLKQLLNNK